MAHFFPSMMRLSYHTYRFLRSKYSNHFFTNKLNIFIHCFRHPSHTHTAEAPPDLLTEMGNGVAQRGTWDRDQPLVWTVQLLDQVECPCDRQRTDEQDDNDRRIAGREQAKTQEEVPGTQDINTHPICILYAVQIAHLTKVNAIVDDLNYYSKAYDWCVQHAKWWHLIASRNFQ